jgi:hypothetical protein
MTHPFHTCLLLALLVATPLRARADASAEDRALARSLFDEGRRLVQAGDYAEACPKLEASQRIDPGIGTAYNLADCFEHLGRLASAWATFREVADAARKARQPERAQVARDRATALEPSLSKVVITVPGHAAVAILWDHTRLDEALSGTPMPVDPGTHTLDVSASGKKSWHVEVQIGEGADSRMVEVPELEDDAAAVPAAQPPPRVIAKLPELRVPPAAPDWEHPAAWVAAGTSVVTLGIGIVFGLEARAKWSEAAPHCPASQCDSTGHPLWSDAKDAARASTIAFVAGGVLLAAAGTFWILAPSSKAPSPQVGVAAVGSSVAVKGVF